MLGTTDHVGLTFISYTILDRLVANVNSFDRIKMTITRYSVAFPCGRVKVFPAPWKTWMTKEILPKHQRTTQKQATMLVHCDACVEHEQITGS